MTTTTTTEPTEFDPSMAHDLTAPLPRAEVLEAIADLAAIIERNDPTLTPLVVIVDHLCASVDQITATHERIVNALDLIEGMGAQVTALGGPLGLLGAIGAGS